LIIFLPIGLTVGPGKKAAKNTLSNKVGEEDFSTDKRQSNFAEKISGLSAWSVGKRL
jgi:hypothetical protein